MCIDGIRLKWKTFFWIFDLPEYSIAMVRGIEMVEKIILKTVMGRRRYRSEKASTEDWFRLEQFSDDIFVQLPFFSFLKLLLRPRLTITFYGHNFFASYFISFRYTSHVTQNTLFMIGFLNGNNFRISSLQLLQNLL